MDEAFTENMLFEFGGSSPYNDYHMVPEGSAFTIFESNEAGKGCAVAYDAGDYKTIGCAFEFGDLIDGTSPSTRARLMLEYLDFFGGIVTSTPEEELNTDDLISDIYPNPSSGQVNISFTLENEMPVSIEIFNMEGQKVATLVESTMKAGTHSIQWNGSADEGYELGSGIYLCTLKSNSVIATKKLIRY